jgi:TonB family protein
MRTTLMVTAVLVATLSAQAPYAPARYARGAAPVLPAMTVGGGQAFLELTVRSNGTVEATKPIRSTPPFTQVLSDAVTGWQFTPALEDAMDADGKPVGSKTVPSKVMVASMFRAPTLLTPTLGEPPTDVGAPSAEVAYPSFSPEPPYPPQALAAGVVLIEASVDTTGRVAAARVISSSPAFDQVALDTARKWRFKPARIKGHASSSYVYLVFGFPQPVTGG